MVVVCRYCVAKYSGCKVIKQCSSTVDAVLYNCLEYYIACHCVFLFVFIIVCKVRQYVPYTL